MIIHQPEIKIIEDEVVVSARVETIAKTPLPKKLWFKFPVEYKDAVSDRADAFFTTLFMLGMHLKEDVEVRGDVSPKLVDTIEKSSSMYLRLDKGNLSKVDYHYDSIKAPNPNLVRDIKLSSFSGGVDSFYTFWSHIFPNQSDHPVQLTHGLFILGFDLLLQNQNNFQTLVSNYQKVFNEWGLSLIHCSTNAYSFYQFRLRWGLPLIPTLAGTATALGNQVSNYYQPGNQETTPANPTNPASYINLFSTETIEIAGHGKDVNRHYKFKKLFDWAPPQKYLRICLSMSNEDGIFSCQKCQKCLNTTLMLYLNDKQKLFPEYSQKFTTRKFLRLLIVADNIFVYFNNNYWQMIKKKKRFDWMLLFWIMVPINFIKRIIRRKIIPRLPRSLILAIKNIVYPKQEARKQSDS